MIWVHRLKGEPFVVNADLIETTPDTVLRLVDGRRAMVAETPDEVIARVIGFRASVLEAAEMMRATRSTEAPRPNLTVLPSDEA